MRFRGGQADRDMLFAGTAAFARLCRRIKQSHFTRKRKMPLVPLVCSILHRKGMTLAMDLKEFLDRFRPGEQISKPGYLRQREKLSPEAIRALYQYHNAGIYRDEDMPTSNGHLVLAADGSTLNVPTTPDTLRLYGTSAAKGAKPQAALGLSALYDVLGKVILDVTINRGRFDEREQARSHLSKLPDLIGPRKSIVLLDRGYPGLLDFLMWMESGQKFVVRLSNCCKRERAAMTSADEVVDVVLDRNRINNYKGDQQAFEALSAAGHITLRLVNIAMGDNTATVATNLGAEEFDAAAIAELYHMRWGIETAFDMLKNNLQAENFTGTKPVLIEQDIYACVYLCNLAQDMIADAEAMNAASGKRPGKHPMAVNRAFAVGVLKADLIEALLAQDEAKRQQMWQSMVEEVRANVLPVRPGRHYERHKGNLSGKYHNNRKRSF
jgi:hypothetical protein